MSESRYKAKEYASQFCHVYLIPIVDAETGKSIGGARTAEQARLLASAPELYAALETLLYEVENCIDPFEAHGLSRDKAKAALSAARGEKAETNGLQGS